MESHEHSFYMNGQCSPTHVLVSCDECGAEYEVELPKEQWDWKEIERREQEQ